MARAPKSSAVLTGLRGDAPAPAPARARSRARRRKSAGSGWLARVAWWLGSTAICAGLGAAGFATGALAAWLETAPTIPAIDNYDPPEMTVLLDRAGEPFATLFEERRRVVPLRELPPELADAFIAIEDSDFRSHVGLNPKAIIRAAVTNLRRGSAAQGASTITQQLPRNLLPEIGREKTLRRKVLETLVALQMERRYSKDQILEVYLNQIYLGSGTYGVEAAAQRYFGKSARFLELEECALLAGLPQLPERYSPLNSPERARTRRDQVLGRLLVLGWIEPERFDEAVMSDVVVATNDNSSWRDHGYFVDAVRAELARQDWVDPRVLNSEGLRIRTTLDRTAQRLASSILAEGLEAEEREWLAQRATRFEAARRDGAWWDLPRPGQVRMAEVVRVFDDSLVVELADGWRSDVEIPQAARAFFDGVAAGSGVDLEVTRVEDGPRKLFRARLLPSKRLQGALVCLDARSGEVRALAGGRSWDDRENDGFFNRATRARRQAGSTMKPFFYAAALESGRTPFDVFVDEPVSFGDYRPRNFDGKFHGRLSLQRALETSNNIVPIRLALDSGLRAMTERVAQFQPDLGGDPWEVPLETSVPLGTTGVTPLELAAAYLPFANRGRGADPLFVRLIRDGRENLLRAPAPRLHQVLDPRVAAWMSQMLAGVVTHGTGRRVGEALPPGLRGAVAGKTGTTSENRDAWFVGYTPQWVVCVWVGFDRPLTLGETRTGGAVAGPIWARFVSEMAAVQPPTEPDPQLPLPEGWEWAVVDLRDSTWAPGEKPGGNFALRAVPSTQLEQLYAATAPEVAETAPVVPHTLVESVGLTPDDFGDY